MTRVLTEGHLFLIYNQDSYGLLVVPTEEAEPGFEPGPVTSRAGLASQGYYRYPETRVLVPHEPQPCPWRSLLLHMATVVLAMHNLEFDVRRAGSGCGRPAQAQYGAPASCDPLWG